MPPSSYRIFCVAFWLAACLAAEAQQSPQQSATIRPGSEVSDLVPRVPGVSARFAGLNAGFTYSGVHTSSQSWYQLVTPAVSYSFLHRYSVDASTPLYLHLSVANLHNNSESSQGEVLEKFDVGDTLIDFHATWRPSIFTDTVTASLTAPTGDRPEGLGTGHVTFDLDNHMERYIRRAGFLVDLGAGDSSNLVNNLVTKDYSSVGPLAHFNAGAILWIYGHNYIESVAYEQLPLGGQTVYTVGGPAGGKGPSKTVTYSNGASEDNGFTTSFGIPLQSHFTLTGYYNRSLRRDLDTVSIGVTYVLRSPRGGKKLSMIDRALREAAGLGADQP